MSVITKIGPYQAFAVRRAVYFDRLPYRTAKSWRLIVSRHPVWLPFGEREGYETAPHVWRLGPVDIAWYGRGR